MLQELQWKLYQREAQRPGREILADAEAHLRKHFGKLDVPYAEFARLRRGKADFPVQGGPETLRALMYQPD